MRPGHGDQVLSWAWAGVAVLLILATLLSALFHRLRPSRETLKTRLRVRTWWVIAGCLFAAMMFGRFGLASLFCLVSLVALQEFVTLDPGMPRRETVRLILGIGTVAVYALMARPCPPPPAWPVWSLLVSMLGTGLVAATGSVSRGMVSLAAFMLGACGLACVVGIAHGGSHRPAPAAGIRLVFLLLALTALNDVAQYLWGKSLGRRAVVPRVSPGKTWAGLLGGVSTTSLLAAGIAPCFTVERWPWGLLIGLLIGFGGFAGDILASAYKRRVGVGESGTLLPGHGGLIDRIDSLCVTAPLLYGVLSIF